MLRKILLSPYYLFLSLRHLFYDKGWKKSGEALVPTVCIGNITVGGTGKTPHTEMVLRILLKSDAWAYRNIAVLSRGYKRSSKGFRIVRRDGSADYYGDEPLQIAKKFPVTTVAVDKDRIEGCRLLHEGASGSPAAEIIVLDDAFQYRKLRAKVNIVLVDFSRPVSKDVLLPLGSLRDLPSRLNAADFIIVTKCPSWLDEWERSKWAADLGVPGYNVSSCRGSDGRYIFFSRIEYGEMTPVFEDADSRFVYSSRTVLFSGIARDGHLVQYLSDSRSVVRRLRFPDHHKYTKRDLRKIRDAVRDNPTALLCTTEKDAQRIVDCKSVPSDLRSRLFFLPISVEFVRAEDSVIFESAFLDAVGQ